MAYDKGKYNGLKIASNTYNTICTTLQGLLDVPEIKNSCIVSHYIIANIINQALFCEIALKALIVRDEKTYGKTHTLDDLFYTLKLETQQLIKREVGVENDTNFANLLTKNNNHFVKWRYFYEGQATDCNPEFMNKFSIAIRTILFNKNLE